MIKTLVVVGLRFEESCSLVSVWATNIHFWVYLIPDLGQQGKFHSPAFKGPSLPTQQTVTEWKSETIDLHSYFQQQVSA